MAYCKNCGAPMDSGSKFCTNCGQSYDAAASAPSHDYTASFDNADIAENRFLALFCYLGFLIMLVPLVAKPNSAFIKFHANQGLVLSAFSICLAIICIVPILGWIAAAVGAIFAFVCLIIGIVNACQGRAVELPLIGSIRIIR